MRPGRLSALTGWLLLALVIVFCAEIFSFAALSLVSRLNQFTYSPPEVSVAEYESYLAERHPVLGWPGKDWLASMTDSRGARISPANDKLDETAPCISIYGDSFAFSDEVGHKHAWGNVLAERLGCRVDNYGVGGFGTGQALLRFEGHLTEAQEHKGAVILTLYPDNLNRNVNQWRYLISGGHPLSLKPVFQITGDGISLVPLFSGDHDAFIEMADSPATHLVGETYAPGSPGFNRRQWLTFPYTLTLGKIIYDQARSIRGFDTDGHMNLYNQPSYYDTASGPSEMKKMVTSRIIARFEEHCSAYGIRCVLILIPDPDLVFQRERNGSHDLVAWLPEAAGNLLYLDTTELFDDLDDICTHLTQPETCTGHYNPAGYERLANFVKEALFTNSR